ncbi:Uncharacterized protein TPAR_05007 [Tolypocladium paradoxum]|uniref:Uncharacterized protein n=1 Tax=Tolypocladium paradoxum TaxID=94208 RepID=A0A2S4KX73_9HYPO|nr:Uncharacterized protein TPAR_05007 [Tolypocladium paradoxum]
MVEDIIARSSGSRAGTAIIKASWATDKTTDLLAPGPEVGEYRVTGLRFSNNVREFVQPSDDAQDLREGSQGPTPPMMNPDGGGIRTSLDGDETLAFVCDYKAAHKLASEYLEAAVAKETLFMEVIELINGDKYQRDKELREKERQESRIDMALTQVFNYMVWYGVAYGYVAAGKSLVFLYFDRAKPQTLYHHLCMPDEEANEALAGDCDGHMARTAAFKGGSLEGALQKAKEELAIWGRPYEDVARRLEADGGNSPSASSSQDTDGSEFRSKAAPATREYPLLSKSSCKSAAVLPGDSDNDDEPDRAAAHPCRICTSTGVKKRRED